MRQLGGAGRVRARPAGANEGVLPVSQLANCLLLLVRSRDDVPRTCREAGEFLAFQRARLPTVRAQQDRRLVGIWIDPVMVDAPPEICGFGLASRLCHFQIRESVGVSGIWCLCWLDADHGGASSDPITLRETLVSALIKQQPSRQHPSAGQFHPVFDADDDSNSILLQTEQLRKVFQGLIGEPMSWDSSTGALTNVIGGRRRN
ncbi:hypothetical protein SAMN04487974_12329 [Pelagibacterium luteolum]|uniref:Uncharacterized protein n=1 Tax=Pelagibacterium luteolum TaxID=440168 RepID=A0A1G7ZW19_9HYPH|nr:hypothetical protein SAMN04487974_12329 [Pelagibacterium luteolum]